MATFSTVLSRMTVSWATQMTARISQRAAVRPGGWSVVVASEATGAYGLPGWVWTVWAWIYTVQRELYAVQLISAG